MHPPPARTGHGRPARLQSALRDFAHNLVRRYDIGDVLYRLSDDVTSVLGVAGSGVSLLDDGILTFVTATSTNVEQVERLQERFNEGPATFEVLRSHRDTNRRLHDVAADTVNGTLRI